VEGVLVPEDDPARCDAVLRDLPGLGGPVGLWRFDLGPGPFLAAVFQGPAAQVAADRRRMQERWGSAARAWEHSEILAFVQGFADWTDARRWVVGWGGALPGFLAGSFARRHLGSGTYVFDLLRGHLWCRGGWTPADIERIREGIGEGEGQVNLDLPFDAREGVSPWGWDPGPEGELWRRIQEALDPEGRLARGRLPGGL
jgi:hypothetical protein